MESNYFIEEYNIKNEKIRILPLSADEKDFPCLSPKEPNKQFVVLYFGTFIPSHGVEYIIEAAKILEEQKDIIFQFCGDGQTRSKVEELAHCNKLTNTEFLGFVSKDILQKTIQNCDISLGAFGKSRKAKNILFNKIFQILSSQRTLITMKTNVVNELGLQNKENCILVSNENPRDLAEAIIYLKNNPQLNRQLAINGHELFKEQFSMKKIGQKFLKILKEFLI